MLDYAGPYEVFAAANVLSGAERYRLLTASPDGAAVACVQGARVLADCAWRDLSEVDVMILPGGEGSRALVEQENRMQELTALAGQTEKIVSICSGARVLGTLGLLDGLPFATHYLVGAEVEAQTKGGRYMSDKRYVDAGLVCTSAAVTAGMDLALYLLEKMEGAELRQSVERYIGYEKRDGRE